MQIFSIKIMRLLLIPALILAWNLSAWAQVPKTHVELVEEAYLAHRRGDLDQAVAGYSSVLQKRGLSARERAIAYLLRGEAKRDQNQPDEAILDFTRALKQWTNYPQALFFRGKVYEAQGKFVEAFADLSRAHDLDPLQESYGNHLAILKKRMSQAGLILQQTGEVPELAEPEVPDEDPAAP